jgi:hypothetical protein
VPCSQRTTFPSLLCATPPPPLWAENSTYCVALDTYTHNEFRPSVVSSGILKRAYPFQTTWRRIPLFNTQAHSHNKMFLVTKSLIDYE